MRDFLLITYHKIILLLFLVLPCSAFVQEEVYILDDKIKGRAYYDFSDASGEMTGAFYFESFKQDTLDPSLYYKYSLKGNYEKGLKDGQWRYDFKELTPIGDLHIDSIGFKESAEGKQRSIIGYFEKGEMSKDWKVMETSIDFSRVEDTLLYYDLNFEGDQIIDEFEVVKGENIISGQVDEDGFVHGEMIFTYELDGNKFIDQRTFDHGRMIDSRLMMNDEMISRSFIGFDIPNKGDEDFRTLEMNEDYLNAIELSQQLQVANPMLKSKRLILESDALLFHAIHSTKNHDDISLWPESPELSFPKIKLKRSTFSPEKQKRITELGEKFEKFEKRVNSVLKDEQVEIIANANGDIQRYKSIYAGLNKNYKQLYEEVVKALQERGAQYLNTSALIDHILDGRSADRSFLINGISETIEIPFQTNPDMNDEVQGINQKLSDLLKFMDSLDNTVGDVLEQEKKRLSLSDEEKVMVDLRDTVHSLYGQVTENEYLKRISGKVVEQTDQEFSAYAKLELNAKVEQLAVLTSCFRSFIDLHRALDRLPKQRNELDSLYTRTVWNPFTYTDMDEIVKERIYNAYDKVLFPHLMDQIEQKLSCSSVDQILHDLPRVIARMQELRNVDTNDLEKELRRENDPLVVEEVLKMELQLF